jgi:hypothetical protein
MRRRRLVLLAGLLFLGLAAGFTLWATWWRNPFHAEKIEIIQKGMSEEEVVKLLGVPPGYYVRQRTKDRVYLIDSLKRPWMYQENAKRWYGEGREGVITLSVVFDEEGRVAEKYSFCEKVRSPLRHALRRWLGP